ncbi:hypothetical protein M885DRAFT_459448 [Pelagophyceae sp. CCMP2097]|nr:hypothetical protein M885DRAFT_459448 [Pelagophyceae sp. CCMP2097]
MADASPRDDDEIALRVIEVEHYMGPAPPFGAIPGLDKVCADHYRRAMPVIRLWGETAAGQKAAVHVHGFFPYFYARPFDDDAEAVRLFDDAERLQRALPGLQSCLDAALIRWDDRADPNGRKHPNAAGRAPPAAAGTGLERVRSISVARLTPFYGFHAEPKFFARVELWSPGDVRKAAALLLDPGCFAYAGTRGRRTMPLQPHESHVDYVMKFFIDFGIFGLGPLFLTAAAARFRHAPKGECAEHAPSPSATQQSESSEAWFLQRVVSWDASRVRRRGLFHSEEASKRLRPRERSPAALELDVCATAITNLEHAARRTSEWGVKGGVLHSLNELYEDEAARLSYDGHAGEGIRRLLKVPDEWALGGDDDEIAPEGVVGPLAQQRKWDGPLAQLRALADQTAVDARIAEPLDGSPRPAISDVAADTSDDDRRCNAAVANSQGSFVDDEIARFNEAHNDDEEEDDDEDRCCDAAVAASQGSFVDEENARFNEANNDDDDGEDEDEDEGEGKDRKDATDAVLPVSRALSQKRDAVGADRGEAMAAAPSASSAAPLAAEDDAVDADDDDFSCVECSEAHPIPSCAHCGGCGCDDLMSSPSQKLQRAVGSSPEDDGAAPLRKRRRDSQSLPRQARRSSAASWSTLASQPQPSQHPENPRYLSRHSRSLSQRSSLPRAGLSQRLSLPRGLSASPFLERAWRFHRPPPSAASVSESLGVGGAYSGIVAEVTPRPFVNGRRLGQGLEDSFDTAPSRRLALGREALPSAPSLGEWRTLVAEAPQRRGCTILMPAAPAPHPGGVAGWLALHGPRLLGFAPRAPRSLVGRGGKAKAAVAWRLRPQISAPDRTPQQSQGSGARDGKSLNVAPRGEASTQSVMCVIAMECFAGADPGADPATAPRVRADVSQDALVAACWRVRRRYGDDGHDSVGAVVVSDCGDSRFWTAHAAFDAVSVVATERALIDHVLRLVSEMDPDILVGWDLERESFAYVVDRARLLSPPLDAAFLLGRELLERPRPFADAPTSASRYGPEGLQVRGRVSVNAWRVVSGDDQPRLRSYTLEHCCQELVGSKLPLYAWAAQASRFASHAGADRSFALAHVARRCSAALAVLTHLDAIGRAAEMARLLGMPLRDALTRGSQHRVEAVLLRVARPRTRNPLRARLEAYEGAPNAAEDGAVWYAVSSPSAAQVAQQSALEVIAMTLEPESGLYSEPVGCLDYQSLYPSVIVAHNLCYTSLVCKLRNGDARAAPIPRRPAQDDEDDEDDDGRQDAPVAVACVEPDDGSARWTTGKLGVVAARNDSASAAALRAAEGDDAVDHAVFVSPSGAVFASRKLREGVLPRMQREILAARFLTKAAMKRAAKLGRGTLVRVLDARQLALKLVANVTYGYAAASFSGRQPCAELADAIVSSGRSYLEAAICIAEGVARETTRVEGAAVKYGDTDSLFVELRGRSVESALRICADIAQRVGSKTPRCVVLKREYVFSPCALVAKKCYCGMQFEDWPGEAHFDCKGLEMARRDKCRFVRETQERVLRALFLSRNVEEARIEFLKAANRAFAGEAPLASFVIRQQARHKAADRDGAAARIIPDVAARLHARGGRVLHKERVAFVVATATTTCLLAKRQWLVSDVLRRPDEYEVDYAYYVHKLLVKPLHRVLGLAPLMCNVERWLTDANAKPRNQNRHRLQRGVGRLTSYFSMQRCQICDGETKAATEICEECARRPRRAMLRARSALNRADVAGRALQETCLACVGASDAAAAAHKCPGALRHVALRGPCDSVDCEVAYERHAAHDGLARREDALQSLSDHLDHRLGADHRPEAEDRLEW